MLRGVILCILQDTSRTFPIVKSIYTVGWLDPSESSYVVLKGHWQDQPRRQRYTGAAKIPKDISGPSWPFFKSELDYHRSLQDGDCQGYPHGDGSELCIVFESASPCHL